MFPGELRAFHAVAQTGSIRKASELLNVAPSSVSRKVALLENQIGTALFDRTHSGVVLTHAGELVAEYARSVVLDYDSLRADLNDTRGSRRRLIRLAAVESSVSGGLVEALTAFRQRFETVTFRLNMVPAPQVVEDVKRGECDVGLTFCFPPQADVVAVASIAEPIMLVVPNDHPLAGAASVTLSDLKGLPLALPELSFGVRRIFDRASHEAGLAASLNIALSSNTFEALRDFVRCGAGVAVLPYRAVLRESEQGRLSAVPIEHASFSASAIDVITLRKHRMPRIVDSFIDQLVRTFAANTRSPSATPPVTGV
jgi:DNA-binding transcriptional LysR family regulator